MFFVSINNNHALITHTRVCLPVALDLLNPLRDSDEMKVYIMRFIFLRYSRCGGRALWIDFWFIEKYSWRLGSVYVYGVFDWKSIGVCCITVSEADIARSEDETRLNNCEKNWEVAFMNSTMWIQDTPLIIKHPLTLLGPVRKIVRDELVVVHKWISFGLAGYLHCSFDYVSYGIKNMCWRNRVCELYRRNWLSYIGWEGKMVGAHALKVFNPLNLD